MTQSVKQYFERIPFGVMGAYRPVDTGFVWTMLDNLAHLVDEFPCYRINYCNGFGARIAPSPPPGTDTPSVVNSSLQMEFPTTVIDNGRYLNYEVRVAAAIWPSGTGTVTASLTAPDAPIPVRGLTNGVLGRLVGNVSSTVVSYVIDGRITDVDPNRVGIQSAAVPAVHGTVPAEGQSAMIKLVLDLQAGGIPSNGYFGIHAITVRELTP